MGVSEKLSHQKMDSGAHVDSEKWVISLRSPLMPIYTKPVEKSDCEEAEECSTTPTSAESRIPTKLVCPPAPKKRKSASASSSRCRFGGAREFFNPPDLETIFIRRVEGS